MPAAVTYPGVYVEEIPSGVRTITPVSTSVTAFVGFTARGTTNKARQIFNPGDFEREFGGLTSGGDLGHAVQHYFLNGGSEAWIVRVAANARAAGIGLRSAVSGGQGVLGVNAASDGDWGNRIRVDVDYDTTNPASLFNLTATEFQDVNGVVTPVRTETYRNLTMNSLAPNDAVKTINAASQLVRVVRTSNAPGLIGTTKGTSTSGDLTEADVAQVDDDTRRLAITLDGDGPYEFDVIDPGGSIAGSGVTKITNLAAAIQQRVRAIKPGSPAFANFTAARAGNTVVATSGGDPGESSSVRFGNASIRNAAVLLKLGTLNGGREVDAAAVMRPTRTGTVGGSLRGVDLSTLPADGTVDVTILVEGSPNVGPITRPLWSAANKPTTLDQVRARLQDGLERRDGAGAAQRAGHGRRRLTASRPGRRPEREAVVRGRHDGRPAQAARRRGRRRERRRLLRRRRARLGGAERRRRRRGRRAAGNRRPARQPAGEARPLRAGGRGHLQPALPPGRDGRQPARRGGRLLRGAARVPHRRPPVRHGHGRRGAELAGREREPPAQERRRLLPAHDRRRPAAELPHASLPRERRRRGHLRAHRHATAASGRRRRAPRRSSAARGASPTRSPTTRTARSTRSASTPAHVPGLRHRRLGRAHARRRRPARRRSGSTSRSGGSALFIEESLYRGTQWVVFEPNDEPLWAQIRLNVGAFMHDLFRQGAFQGTTPREAYFVKCDKETTTQNDIDLGIVNIVVGFAPLKPAEFVIIKIQQIAGQIET